MTTPRDTLFTQPLDDITQHQFTFDDNVARVFPDMIKRSVPGYSTIINMTGLLASKYAQPDSRIYDLGCSLGASTLSMRNAIGSRNCQIIGVDNSTAMLSRCQAALDSSAPKHTDSANCQLICADIADVAIENASVVVLNFTLQFIPVKQRAALIDNIYQGMRSGGILVLSEKVIFEDTALNQLNIDLHHQFKRDNGYSELEVARKRSALEDVLLPESLTDHKARIAKAGFGSCDVWFQCFNFASLIALK